MKSFIASNVMRTGRALVALVVATLAFVWLLGMWSGLPPAEARGPAIASTGGDELRLSASSMLTIYLPILFKSDVVFFDDFSSTSSGWATGKFESCERSYNNGHYRVKVTSNGQPCIIHNGNVPNLVEGTFKIRVRRTSSESYPLFYGFLFGHGAHADTDRWALEVYPNIDCSNKPFFWLSALVNGDSKFFQDECTDVIDTDQNDWNELKVIRDVLSPTSQNIKVYINGQKKGEYNAGSQLITQGGFSLEVISASDQDITVEYDDLEITRRTTP